MILMIDNYDSFTYNLVQLFQKLGQQVTVYLNDKIDADTIRGIDPTAVILSPGPCTPAESGNCPSIVEQLHSQYPLLGVCLGHQIIGSVFGATVERAGTIMHGKTDRIALNPDPFFNGLPPAITAARYHSLEVTRLEASKVLTPLAFAESDHCLMAMKHKDYPVYGLQFHPESYASEYGAEMAQNFLAIAHNVRSKEAHHDARKTV